MKNKNPLILSLLLLVFAPWALAEPNTAQLAVWANEAIVTTYTYDYKNYLQQQKEIAKYFTSEGWINYTKALNVSKLPESVQKNAYYVSAVALEPPKMVTLDPTHWQAIMPLLVVYKNPQYQQQQTLKIILSFTKSRSGQGVRGFSITSLKATVTKPPCQCSFNEKSEKQE